MATAARPRPAPSPPPVAIGGVGGSGTRLVAQFLRELGFFLGADLNESNDTLWFTLLFKHPAILEASAAEFQELLGIFESAMRGAGPLTAAQGARLAELAAAERPLHDADWLGQRKRSLEAWMAGAPRPAGPWGWKEPNTHVVLPRLVPLLPGMKYVHVVRNGLDMAYSSNQAQLELWGPSFLGLGQPERSPRLALKYWRAVHTRVLEASQGLGERFLMLNYDRLCVQPERGLSVLLRFLELEPAPALRRRLLAWIRPPESLGRFRSRVPSDFDADDVAFARELGFDVDYGAAELSR